MHLNWQLLNLKTLPPAGRVHMSRLQCGSLHFSPTRVPGTRVHVYLGCLDSDFTQVRMAVLECSDARTSKLCQTRKLSCLCCAGCSHHCCPLIQPDYTCRITSVRANTVFHLYPFRTEQAHDVSVQFQYVPSEKCVCLPTGRLLWLYESYDSSGC